MLRDNGFSIKRRYRINLERPFEFWETVFSFGKPGSLGLRVREGEVRNGWVQRYKLPQPLQTKRMDDERKYETKNQEQGDKSPPWNWLL